MKTFLYLTAWIFISSLISSGQNYTASIEGYVFDKETGKGIESVNVYLSNTTFGDATDADGYFRIGPVPPGMHELVASVVGYKVDSRMIEVEDGPSDSYDFRLRPEIYQSETIEVSAAEQAQWFKDVKNFKKYFLGSTSFAKKCRIENEYVLDFEWDLPDILYAKASKPLIIINNALGFRITLVLLRFSWEKNNMRWSWVIKPHYEEMEPESEDEAEEWAENRRKSYRGSLHHFLLALVSNEIRQNNYNIQFTKKAADRLAPLERFPAYAGMIVREALLPNENVIAFENFLKVVYRGAYMSYNPPRHQTSWLRLRREQVTLDENGYAKEYQPFEVYGYWATLGVANILPRYYFIE